MNIFINFFFNSCEKMCVVQFHVVEKILGIQVRIIPSVYPIHLHLIAIDTPHAV